MGHVADLGGRIPHLHLGNPRSKPSILPNYDGEPHIRIPAVAERVTVVVVDIYAAWLPVGPAVTLALLLVSSVTPCVDGGAIVPTDKQIAVPTIFVNFMLTIISVTRMER
jgi:hypothetical protein